MIEILPVIDTTGYILSSAITIVVYDVVTHLDEEIDYIMRSKSIPLKVIFILCRYLPIIIGAIRIPFWVVGASINDEVLNCNSVSSSANHHLDVADIELLEHLALFIEMGCVECTLLPAGASTGD
ncbi:hypothetical protein DFH29DRAFT_1006909 [Suillus ampliporus]|nr:hypothetical protein DFH29DRAFT_1006909 [Suillus ampliporus]